MGVTSARGFSAIKEQPMRQRLPARIHAEFKDVSCPYPAASTHYGAYGAVNYSLDGPSSGELVVCFHGLNASRTMFKPIGDALAKSGFQVLAFDLYGHGLSNAPIASLCPCRMRCRLPCCHSRGRYDLDMFIEQTADLLESLGFAEQPANLIGFSLGGLVAAAFSDRYPERVLRMVLLSPAGCLARKGWLLWQHRLLRATWCMLIPLASYILSPCCYRKEKWTKGQDKEMATQAWSRLVWSLFIKKGVASASLAIMLRIPWFGQDKFYKRVGSHRRPVLLIWGEQDSFNPASKTLQEHFPNSHLLVISRAEHIVIADQPQLCFNAIYDFFRFPSDIDMKHVRPGSTERCRLVLDASYAVERLANMPAPGLIGSTSRKDVARTPAAKSHQVAEEVEMRNFAIAV